MDNCQNSSGSEFSSDELAESDQDLLQDEEKAFQRAPRIRLFAKTSLLISANLLYGIQLSLIGSLQPDLVRFNDFDYEQLSIAASMFAIGALLGSPFGTFFSTNLHQGELLLTVNVAVGGLLSVAIPFAHRLPLLGVLWGLQGAMLGSADVICINLLIHLWQTKSSSVLGAYTVGSTVGTIIGPFIAAPFLSSTTTPDTRSHHAQSSRDVGFLYVPYLIAAVLAVILACSLLFDRYIFNNDLDTLSRSLEIESSTDSSSNDSKSGDISVLSNRSSGAWFFVSLAGFFIVASVIARDMATLNYSVTITSETFSMSAQRASLFGTLLNTVRGFGRLTLTVLPMCLPLPHIVVAFTAFPLVCSLFLMLFGLESWTSYYILMALQTFSCSPSYPLTLAWISGLLPQDRMVCGILCCGNGVGGLAGMWGSGWAFVNYGPHGWFCWLLVLSCCSAVLVLGTSIGVHCSNTRVQESGEIAYLNDDKFKAAPTHGSFERTLSMAD
ncbi:hypothetical protein CAPTEDRAFT_185499 [Capitella teleta]|uniref:Major facilitator superfamily (MFS) profile domain-containing protein n=1 Tax=Capitella teleta TaxID=283909 RepID=R7VJI4_CAPTE|nr:hypothetical protein CAPTEDRAFT_185499 [Capitella teleta]|eukprot:ELU16536.1 hypothetical protein CAPTEDRAFT_185499 [Capitella teleta]